MDRLIGFVDIQFIFKRIDRQYLPASIMHWLEAAFCWIRQLATDRPAYYRIFGINVSINTLLAYRYHMTDLWNDSFLYLLTVLVDFGLSCGPVSHFGWNSIIHPTYSEEQLEISKNFCVLTGIYVLKMWFIIAFCFLFLILKIISYFYKENDEFGRFLGKNIESNERG